MKGKFVTVLAALLCVALVIPASGCNKAAPAAAGQSGAIRVQVQSPARGALEQTAAFTGRVSPDESVYVIGKVSGTVTATHFDVGDSVKKGDLLYEIDPVDVNLAVAQAKSAYEAAQASVAQASGSGYDAQLLSAQSALKQAQSAKKWTEDTYDVYDESYSATSKLLREQAKGYQAVMQQAKEAYQALDVADPAREEAYQAYLAAQAAYQKAQASYDTYVDSYQAQYNQLTQGLEQTEIGVDAAEQAYNLISGTAREELLAVVNAQLAQAKAGYDAALQQLSYTKVAAPIDGVVEYKSVSANGMSTPSTPAYVISNRDALCVTFSVSAGVAGAMSIGDAVKVENGSQTYAAEVVEIAAAVDAASGLFPIKARIAGSPSLPSGIAVKLTAITARASDSLIVPVSAVYYDRGSAYVYTAADNTARKTPVTLGIVVGDKAQVIDGLTQDAEIITTWNPNLTDGISVEVGSEG